MNLAADIEGGSGRSNGRDTDLLELLPESVIVRDADGAITYWNAAAEAMYGWPREEALGRKLAELLCCETPDSQQARDGGLSEQDRWTGEIWRKTKSGTEVLVDARSIVRREHGGNVVEIIETTREVVGRQGARREEQQLGCAPDERQEIAGLDGSDQKYRYLFQRMPVSLWQLDSSEIIQRFKDLREQGVTRLEDYLAEHPEFVAEAMRAIQVQQVNDHTVRLFGGVSPEDFKDTIERYWKTNPGTIERSLRARFSGAEHFAEETRVDAVDGRVIHVLFTCTFPGPLDNLGVSLVGMVDITDRTNAEKQLRQVEADFAHAARVATLGELTASIAHEVNQPLAAITTNGDTILRWLSGPQPNVDEATVLATRIVADARRAADVIARIRSMATRQSPESMSIAINDAVRSAVGFLARELQDHGVHVDFTLSSGNPKVMADETQLQQVLVNLVVNAINAMADKAAGRRRIHLRTFVEYGEVVTVEVEDHGGGIAEDQLKRVFDSFYTTKPSGLGIGLSISRSIVEAHGGSIACENTRDGARFRFTLPLSQ